MKKLIGLIILIAGLAALASFARKWIDENRDLVSDNVSRWSDVANEKASQAASMIREQSKTMKSVASDAADKAANAANAAKEKVASAATQSADSGLDANADAAESLV